MSYLNRQPKDFIKSLQIIHFTLLFVVVSFGAFVVINGDQNLVFTYKEDKSFLYLAILIAFIGNLSSKFLYAKLIKKIPEKADLLLKASKFSTAHIFRMAMLEFPALICIIFIMKFNNSFYFIIVGILILMILAIYPTKAKFQKDVTLTNKQKSMLEKL